jgi:phosphoserine phosphatase RsbU/P
MRSTIREFVLVACVSAMLASAAMGQPSAAGAAESDSGLPATFVFAPDRAPATSLAGLWRFKPGDDARYAGRDFDDSTWALLRSGRPWTEQGYQGLSGYAWYRFRVVLPGGDERISLLLPTIANAYDCYVDGKLIHTEGAMPPANGARFPLPAAIDFPAAEASETYTVALRVWFDPKADPGRLGGPQSGEAGIASVGEAAAIHQRLSDYFALQRQKSSAYLDLSALFLLAGVICLTLFFMERMHREYLWYGVVGFSYGCTLLIGYDQLTHSWPINLYWFAITATLMISDLGLNRFFKHLLGAGPNWLFLVFLAIDWSDDLAEPLFHWGLMGQGTKNLLDFCSVFFSLWVIGLVVKRVWQRVPDAIFLLLPILLNYDTGIPYGIGAEVPWLAHRFLPLMKKVLISYPIEIRAENLADVLVLVTMLGLLLARFARIRREHDRITSEMKTARSIQHLLIPDVLPEIPGLRIEAAYHPAQEVGGDFFQVIPMGNGKTLIVLGDVSGKGLPAAMTVSLVVGIVRTLVEFRSSPAAILAGLNGRLIGRGAGFTTCLALEISRDGTMVFANAGQLAPYRNGVEIPSEAALPLGLIADVVFPESTAQLAEGDRITLITDGIPEAASSHELFGFERTEELSRQSAQTIADAARRFGQTDDITVLSIDFVSN